MGVGVGTKGYAIHIVADVLSLDGYKHLPPLSCDDHVARVTSLCEVAGIQRQHIVRGSDATCAQVGRAFDDAASCLASGDTLVVTFAGHSLRSDSGEDDTRWCLHDGTLTMPELASLFRRLPCFLRILVVADTCHAGAVSLAEPIPQALIVLAACRHDQWTINRRRSEFIGRLSDLIFPGGRRSPHCNSYSWLAAELCKDAPDVELPQVSANSHANMAWRPFELSLEPRCLEAEFASRR